MSGYCMSCGETVCTCLKQTYEELEAENAELKARIKAMEEQEPVAWTTMPEAYDWVFVSGAENPNGKLIGKFHPLYSLPTISMLDMAQWV